MRHHVEASTGGSHQALDCRLAVLRSPVSRGVVATVDCVSPTSWAAAAAGQPTGPGTSDGPEGLKVDVRRSRRRRRTVSAYRDGDTVVVQVPARLTRAEEAEWVSRMLARLEQREARRKPGEVELARRAAQLSSRYLGGRATPASVRWVDNQQSRWGSCTVADRSIRLSTRLQGMPGWVVDYVLLHELAHLLVPGHDARFWALLEGYERTERARGYLEGFSSAAGLPPNADA